MTRAHDILLGPRVTLRPRYSEPLWPLRCVPLRAGHTGAPCGAGVNCCWGLLQGEACGPPSLPPRLSRPWDPPERPPRGQSRTPATLLAPLRPFPPLRLSPFPPRASCPRPSPGATFLPLSIPSPAPSSPRPLFAPSLLPSSRPCPPHDDHYHPRQTSISCDHSPTLTAPPRTPPFCPY